LRQGWLLVGRLAAGVVLGRTSHQHCLEAVAVVELTQHLLPQAY
jgi:hypothetical protein